MTGDSRIIYYGAFISALVLTWAFIYTILVKRKLSIFTSGICATLDDMLQNKEIRVNTEEENLFVKINHKLIKLYEIMRDNRSRLADDKTALEALITDISHQVKTPISNLKMINATLLENNIPEEKRKEFLRAMDLQLEKLDFLLQAMIKTSRLEIGMITLDKKAVPIFETLATALGGIVFAAEKKDISVSVDCPEDLTVPHDKKWTAEAFFNILENAVKYTGMGGSINVEVNQLEMYTKIEIADNGKGIAESRQPEIFKRFYREEEIHDIPGIGIGLYLVREIIMLQGGYIKLKSEFGSGSTFSVYLPNS